MLALIFILPFLWLISTSLKTLPEAFRIPPGLLPEVPQWKNYSSVFEYIPFARYFLNTVIITAFMITGLLVSTPMAAYSVSKINWKGKKYLFPLMLATIMLPFQVTMIPLYLVFQKIHVTGTILPLILPAFFGGGIGGGYYIFLLRQFFLTIPDSLFDSARIDGAAELRIYTSILLPLSKPALATVGIFAFFNSWSDFLGPLIYLTKKQKYTLSLGLQAFLGEHHVQWHLLMAAALLFALPMIIVFMMAQNFFIEGIRTSGLKY